MIVQIVNNFLLPVLILLLLVVTSYSNISASYRSSIANTAIHMQVTPTPNSQAEWIIAGDNKRNDWELYLTGDDIRSIALDNNIIWAASDGGLLRWERDTGRVTQYLTPAFPLPSNDLSELLLYEDKLYISSYAGIAMFDKQDQWEGYSRQEMGLENSLFASIAMIEGELWVAGRKKIAKLLPDGRWDILSFEGFEFYEIVNIISDSGESYVVVSLGPEHQYERKVLHFIENSWELVEDSLPSDFKAPDGSLWSWSKGKNGLAKSEDSGRTWQTVIETKRYIQLLSFDEQGRVYAAMHDTIFVIEKDEITETYQFTSVGPELSYINIMKWDKQNRLWMATDGLGMTMFDGKEWFNWQPENSDIRARSIRGLAIGDNKIYGSAGSGGIDIFDLETEQWTNLWPGESELSGDGVFGVAIDKQGRAFFPTAVGILDIYDGDEWQHVPIPNESQIGTPSYFMSEGVFDKEGSYWVASNDVGLWEYDGTNWSSHHIQGSVEALAFDQDNRLWVGSSSGLTLRDEALNWSFYTSFQLGLDDGRIRDIAIDAERRVWAVTRHHLLVFNGREFQIFLPQIVGEKFWGNALTFDSEDNLWVATDSGFVKFKGEPDTPSLEGLVLEPQWVQPDSKLSHEFRNFEQILTSIFKYAAIMGFWVLLLLVGGAGVYWWFKRNKYMAKS